MQSEFALYLTSRNAAQTEATAMWARAKSMWPGLEEGGYIGLTEITSTYLNFFLAAFVASCSASNVLKVSAS